MPKSVVDSAPTVGCGDIDPLGITGTPVIDAATDEIFVAEETELAGQRGWQGIRHWLVAISLSSHEMLWHRDIDPPHRQQPEPLLHRGRAAAPGAHPRERHCSTSTSGVSTVIAASTTATSSPVAVSGCRAARELPGPDSARGRDLGDERGRRVATRRPLRRHGQRELQLRWPTSTRGTRSSSCHQSLKRISYWAPSDWVELNDQDWDLGSAGPINVPGTSLLFIAGKPSANGDTGYLMSEGHLGGIGHGAYSRSGVSRGRRLRRGRAPTSSAQARVRGSSSTQRAGAGPRRSRSPPHRQRSTACWSPSFGSPNGPPIVAGGLVWALDWDGAALYGMNPVTGHVVVHRTTDDLEHFATPGVGDGMLLVPSAGGVEAFRTLG